MIWGIVSIKLGKIIFRIRKRFFSHMPECTTPILFNSIISMGIVSDVSFSSKILICRQRLTCGRTVNCNTIYVADSMSLGRRVTKVDWLKPHWPWILELLFVSAHICTTLLRAFGLVFGASNLVFNVNEWAITKCCIIRTENTFTFKPVYLCIPWLVIT